MATVNPNSIAVLIKNKMGFVARVSGEVLYIMKCLALPVEVRREKKCYSELPVTAYNKSFYMSPVTRILQEHAEEIECNAIIPSMYFLENKWIGFDPYPSHAIVPQELRVDEEKPPKFYTIKDLGAGGLYTYQEIRKAQDAMMFNLERNALTNILIRKVAGQEIETQGFSTLNLFSKEEMEKLANTTIQKLYGYFTIVGEWTSGVLGLYFIFRFFKFLLETFMNAIAIHRLNGCSLHMLASFWDTLTLFVLHHKQKKNAETTELNQVTNSYFKIKGPDAEVPTSSAPSAVGQRKHVTFNISNETTNQNTENTQTNYATLKEELSKVPTVNWSFFNKTKV
jgi:hypothetical protein